MASGSAAPLPDLRRAGEALVAGGRRLGARGLVSATEGNLSVRVEDGSLLITPSGRRKDELASGDLVVTSLRAAGDAAAGGPDAGPRPSSDIAIHRAVYEARPDVVAVVHAHLPAAMALTLAGEVPDPGVLPETALLLPRLPFVPFAAPGSALLASGVAAAFTAGAEPRPGAVLLERHGAVAVGSTVDEAVDRLELVEVLCRAWRDALLVRAAAPRAGREAILRPASLRPGSSVRGSTRRDR